MGISVGTPVWTTSTADVGPVFTQARTFAAGDRVSIAVGHRNTTAVLDSVVFDGVDSGAHVENYPTGTNVAHLHVWELVISAGGTGDLVVTFAAALGSANVIVGTSVIGSVASGSGWRDAPVETGNTTNESATITIGSESGDEVIGWAMQRGATATMVADGNTTEVGAQASTAAAGGTHVRMALWRRNGASPDVAIGGAFNSTNGYALVGHNLNLVPVNGSGTLPLTLGLAGAGTVAVQGAGTLALTLGLAGAGTVAVQGAGTLPLILGLTGTGAVGSVPVTGDGVLALTLGLAGAGTVAVSAAGSLPLVLGLAGAGTVAITGAGSLPLVLSLAGAGTVSTGAPYAGQVRLTAARGPALAFYAGPGAALHFLPFPP